MRIVTLLLIAFPLAAFGVSGNTDNPEEAWQQYLETGTNIKPRYRFPHASCFRSAAAATDLPMTLLIAVARGESDFDATARSKANAHGVMQILWPATANHLGIYRLSELYEPCKNIDAGARYLKELLTRFDGNLHLALAAYNYGPERISADITAIPSGARWYSGYIYGHLDYVLGDGKMSESTVQNLYSEMGRSTLVSFSEPYRAAAFVARLEQQSPDLELDWFRKGVGKFSVVLVYESRSQFDSSATALAIAGFPIE